MGMIGLIVLVFFAPLVLAAQVPYNTTITSVDIDGDDPEVLDTLSLRPGYPLTPETLHQAIQSLYDAARYGRIDVQTLPEPGGTRVVFRVEAPYFFATTRLEPDNVLDRAISSYVRLPYGQRFSRNQLDEIVAGVQAALQAEGYFAASVTSSLNFDSDTRLVTTTVRVERGSRAVVGDIEFGGQETFSTDELRSTMDIDAGESFLRTRMDERLDSIQDLFAESNFVNTRVTVDGLDYDSAANVVDVRITIDAGQYLTLNIDGYDLSDEQREELLPFSEEQSVDEDLVQEGRVALLEHLYREGFLEATVQVDFLRAPLDPAYQVDYVIETGERFAIQEVRLDGNRFFTDDVLYERIGISPDGLFSRGVFSEELREEAGETIRQIYRVSGFADTLVTSETSRVGGEITVVLNIVEGPRLVVGNLFIDGTEAFEADVVGRWAEVSPGMDYTDSLVREGRRAITSQYHEGGHEAVRVESIVEQTGRDRVDITYRIVEGDSSKIRQIFVAGNTLTQEKIVHRNSGLKAGANFDPESILEAQQKLYATGLFNRVDIVTLDRPELDGRDLLIQLEDAGPVVLTYGVGAQDREGIRGTVEVTHSNLWGLDRSISARIRGSKREQRFQTTYREPRLFNRELDGFASLFIERATRPAFDVSKVDFSLQSLKQFANQPNVLQENLLLTASYQTVNLRDIRDNRRTEEFPDEEGIIQIARLGTSYIRDTRNDAFNPSRGNYFTGTFQFANQALGSEVNFTSLFTQFRMYRPAKDAVIAASARFGWNQPYGVTESLPITERYFAGGSTTLRGFGLDDAGPTAGGNALAIVNVEYRFPIPFLISGFGGTVFYDTGTVFERISDFTFGDFTHTAGFGFRYQTPIGPIRVDFGVNLNRQPGEDPHKAFFTLGHTF